MIWISSPKKIESPMVFFGGNRAFLAGTGPNAQAKCTWPNGGRPPVLGGFTSGSALSEVGRGRHFLTHRYKYCDLCLPTLSRKLLLFWVAPIHCGDGQTSASRSRSRGKQSVSRNSSPLGRWPPPQPHSSLGGGNHALFAARSSRIENSPF